MVDVLELTAPTTGHFAALQQQLGASESLAPLRGEGLRAFSTLGFPALRNEDWIFTNVAPIAKTPFELPKAPASLPAVADLTIEEAVAELVFVDGFFVESLSRFSSDAAVSVSRLSDGWTAKELGSVAPLEIHPFVALNAALLNDGIVVRVGAGAIVDRPVHVLFVSTGTGAPQISSARILFIAGESSQSKLVETFAGARAGSLTNAVTEIIVGDNATVDHTKLQRESDEAFHIAFTGVVQQRDSVYVSHALLLGGGLTRNEISVALNAPGADCTLDGLFVGVGRQHIDNHLVVDHVSPNAGSRQLYKGILDQEARGIFDGKIIVRKDAQKTSSRQTNNNLLLSDKAIIDSKPQLEIYADDVKCNHGSTIGQLDDEAMFYLQSRGIGAEDARNILVFAFAKEIVERLKVGALCNGIEKILLSRLPQNGAQSK